MPEKLCQRCNSVMLSGGSALLCIECDKLAKGELASPGEEAETIVEGGPANVAMGATGLPERSGAMIGCYKLLEVIGEGGFGTVWLAEQEQPVSRRVAL